MANINTGKKVIGILTGGGDVPGLNACIKAVVNRADEAYALLNNACQQAEAMPRSTA